METKVKKPLKRGTPKQRRLAEAIVKNAAKQHPETYGEIIREAGYSEARSTKPSELINSVGVQTELEILGFNERKAKEVVGEILGDDKQQAKDRLKAAEMVFKVQGTFAPDVVPMNTGNTYNVIFSAEVQDRVKAIEAEIKTALTQPRNAE